MKEFLWLACVETKEPQLILADADNSWWSGFANQYNQNSDKLGVAMLMQIM